MDIAILLASGVLASRACGLLGVQGLAEAAIPVTITAATAATLMLHAMGAYGPSQLGNLRLRLRSALFAVALGGATAAACFALTPDQMAALRLWPLLWMAIAGAAGGSAVALSASLARSSGISEQFARRVAVVGVSAYSHAFATRLMSDRSGTASFVGLYDDGEHSAELGTLEQPVLGGIPDLVARSRRERIDAIVLAMPSSDQVQIARSRAALSSVTTDIYLATGILDLTCKASRIDRLGNNPVVKIRSRPLTERQTLQKAAMDWTLAAILVVATAPLLALIALLVRIDSPGPVLFRQPRLGFNNNMFDVYKFRTMYSHLADLKADRQTTRDDPRITRVGRFLRRTSLDEVPQIFNVLRGEMSLVGPRPHAPNTKAGDALFPDVVADYATRHRVKPGITGWAQVNGWRGETRTREQIEQRVAHDLHYIDNWSLMFDAKILVLTVVRELNSKVAF